MRRVRGNGLANLLRLLVVCVGLLTAFPTGGQSAREETTNLSKASWKLDLRGEGFTADSKLDKEPRLSELRESLAYLGNDVVAAVFLKRGSSHGQKPDAASNSLPFDLNVVFLDSSTGKVIAHESYPSATANAGLISLSEGGYFIYASGHAGLYSPDRTLVKDVALPLAGNPKLVLLGVASSPNGQLLLIRYLDAQQQQCVWLSAPQMQMKTEPCQMPTDVAISEHQIAIVDHPYPKSSEQKIAIHVAGAPWHLLCDWQTNPSCGQPRFIDDSTILLSTLHALSAQHVGGQVLVSDEMSKNIPSGGSDQEIHSAGVIELRPSANGNRFAAVIYGRRANVQSFDEKLNIMNPGAVGVFDHVRVYDFPARRWIYSVGNDNLYDQSAGDVSGIALSPNGMRMAIENGGVIRVFALPQ